MKTGAIAWIFEEAKEGIEGEPARARMSLKLAAIAWAVHLLSWEIDLRIIKLLSALFLISAVAATARCFFHSVTIAVARLPHHIQAMAQLIVAVIGAAIPLAYFLRNQATVDITFMIKVFEPFLESWAFWIMYGFYVYLTYVLTHAMVSNRKPILPVRPYLILVGVVFILVFVGGHGGFSSPDEDGYYLSDAAMVDPESVEGQIHMAASYLCLVILGYGAILSEDLYRRYSRRRLDLALKRLGEP